MSKGTSGFLSRIQRDTAARAATAAVAPFIGGRRVLIKVLPSGAVKYTPAKQVTQALLKTLPALKRVRTSKKSASLPTRKGSKKAATSQSSARLSEKEFTDSVKLIAGTD